MDSIAQGMLDMAQKQYPVMQNYPYTVRTVPSTSYGEYYAPTESESPNPGVATFDTPKGSSPTYMAGEYMHLLAQQDPYYKYMAGQFDANRTPEARDEERGMQVQRAKEKNQKPRPFTQYWNMEGREAHLRAGLFPQEFGVGQDPSWAEVQKMYTPPQNAVVNALKDFMNQKQFDQTGNFS